MIPVVEPRIEEYAAAHSEPPAELLRELETYTHQNVAMPQMLVGGLEGALLGLLTGLCGAQRVLEIGLFTGYSALSMAAALPEDGQLVSCEIDPKHADIARSFITRSPHGHKIDIRLGPALETLATLAGPFDLVFLDADKESYVDYFEAVLPMLRTGGLLVADNVLWSGRVLDPRKETDHALVRFNDHVVADPRVETVMLTVRDGVSLIRKR
ncbi:MAG: class I SAM-dependent methyltransferase [Gammaproteobacteria bacterium]|nr:class I SAM-dependent methyltransferase [Gammaproteobacteria bacterium]